MNANFNKWVAAYTLLLFTATVTALPAELTLSYPAAVYFEEFGEYQAFYNAVDENEETLYPLTPDEHNAACVFTYGENEYWFTYNTETQAHELTLGYPNALNYSLNLTCFADDYDEMNLKFTQEVLPAQTAVNIVGDTPKKVGENISINISYYSLVNGRTLTNEDGATCNATFYNETGNAIQLEVLYNSETEQFDEVIEIYKPGNYTWNAACTALPNFEPAQSTTLNITINPISTSISVYQPNYLSVEQTRLVEVLYTALLENGTIYALTPGHEATCTALINNETSKMEYNFETNAFEVNISYNTIGNYLNQFKCTAPTYEEQEQNTTVNVQAAPTFIIAWDDTTDPLAPKIRGIGDNVTFNVIYSTIYNGRMLGEADGANCNISLYDNENNFLGEAALVEFNNETEEFQLTTTLNTAGTYWWNASCTAAPNFEPAQEFAYNTTIVTNACDVEITEDITFYEDSQCTSEETAGDSLYEIFSNNVVLNYNWFSLSSANELIEKYAIEAQNIFNLSIFNSRVENYSIGLYLANVTNATVANFSAESVEIGAALYTWNSLVENFNVSKAILGFYTNGTRNTLRHALFNNTQIGIQLAGRQNSFEDVKLYNTNQGIALSEGAVNNTFTINTLNNNLFDLYLNDSTGGVYNNTFILNTTLTSVFFNVTNSTQRIIATFKVNFTANNTLISYGNLTLYNDTGIVNSSNLTNHFNLTNTSASLNSSEMPFLSQEARITFSRILYSTNEEYEIIRDGVPCIAPTCVKISSNPVVIKVNGFSSYEIKPVQTTPTVTVTSGGGGGGGGAAPAPAAPSAPALAIPAEKPTITKQNNEDTKLDNKPTTKTTETNIKKEESQTQLVVGQKEIPTQSSVTGLFTAIPKELNNPLFIPLTALAIIALVALLARFKK